MLRIPVVVTKWRRTHPLARRCLLAWILILPLALWVASLKGPGWTVVSQILTPLAGSFGAVFLGSLFLDRWRLDLQVRERRAWLRHNASLIVDQQQLARNLLCEVAVAAYDGVRPFTPDREQVSDELLSWDLKAGAAPHDGTPDGAIAQINDLMRVAVDGPLTWVTAQASAVADAAYWIHQDRAINDHAAAIRELAESTDDDDLRASFKELAESTRTDWSHGMQFASDGVARLLRIAPPIAELAVIVSAQAAAALRDLGTLELLKPLRAEEIEDVDRRMPESSEPAPGAKLVYYSHLLELAAYRLDRASNLPDDMTVRTDEEPSEDTVAILQGMSDLLTAVADARSSLQDQARVTAHFVDRATHSTIGGIATAAARDVQAFRDGQYHDEWVRFREGRSQPRKRARRTRTPGEGASRAP